jgi:hypothetical protein
MCLQWSLWLVLTVVFKYLTIMEMHGRDKHASLLQRGINYHGLPIETQKTFSQIFHH